MTYQDNQIFQLHSSWKYNNSTKTINNTLRISEIMSSIFIAFFIIFSTSLFLNSIQNSIHLNNKLKNSNSAINHQIKPNSTPLVTHLC